MPQRAPRIEVVVASLCSLGESPQWDVTTERLYWAATHDGLIFSARADGREVEVQVFPAAMHAFSLTDDGGAIVMSGSTISRLDLSTGAVDEIRQLEHEPGFNGNDAKVDRQGRWVFGITERALAKQYDTADISAVARRGGYYRLDAARDVTQIVDDIGITNGPCFSPDGTAFYCGDSWLRRIYVFDYDPISGAASNRRVLTQFADTGPGREVARPDGATVDADGGIWVAAVYAGEVRRYLPDGTLDQVVRLPVPKPTSVAFGGPGLDILYVSSMADRGGEFDAPRAAVPLAGSVFALHDFGVRGVPEIRFKV